MYRHLTSCRDQLLVQLQHARHLPRITELHTILVHLADDEKHYLRNTFLGAAWNLGSTIVLGQLQRASILTMTDYIWMQFQANLSPNNDSTSFTMIDSEEADKQTGESVQLILNDLLETEFVLLADLARSIRGSGVVELKVSAVLRECFQRLIGDLAENPELVQVNCLRELRKYLSEREMGEVRTMVWGVFEEMESCSALEAIERQAMWNQEFKQTPSGGSLVALMREVASDEVQFVHRLLLVLTVPDSFAGWKWWLRFYGLIVANDKLPDKVFLTIRQQLKELFRQFQQPANSETLFYAMMLCARQTCHFASAGGGRFENYSKWYKNTIGEMQYGQSGKEEFRRTMQIMAKMIKHETEADVLEVHARTAIAAPAFCGDLVLSFKQVSKSWLEDLSRRRRSRDDEDVSVVMVID